MNVEDLNKFIEENFPEYCSMESRYFEFLGWKQVPVADFESMDSVQQELVMDSYLEKY